jgi:hypothetical protein
MTITVTPASCNPLCVEEGVSGVGSEGPRKTGTSRAVCAGVAVPVHLGSSRRDVSARSFSVTRENTAGSANARGGRGVTTGVHPRAAVEFDALARNSLRKRRIAYASTCRYQGQTVDARRPISVASTCHRKGEPADSRPELSAGPDASGSRNHQSQVRSYRCPLFTAGSGSLARGGAHSLPFQRG